MLFWSLIITHFIILSLFCIAFEYTFVINLTNLIKVVWIIGTRVGKEQTRERDETEKQQNTNVIPYIAGTSGFLMSLFKLNLAKHHDTNRVIWIILSNAVRNVQICTLERPNSLCTDAWPNIGESSPQDRTQPSIYIEKRLR